MWYMQNLFHFDEQEGIISLIYVGDQTRETVKDLWPHIEAAAQKLREQGKPILVLGDTTQMAHQDSGSREAGKEIITRIGITKYALVITSPYLRVVSSLIAKASGLESKVRNFSTKEEAISWLQQADDHVK